MTKEPLVSCQALLSGRLASVSTNPSLPIDHHKGAVTALETTQDIHEDSSIGLLEVSNAPSGNSCAGELCDSWSCEGSVGQPFELCIERAECGPLRLSRALLVGLRLPSAIYRRSRCSDGG